MGRARFLVVNARRRRPDRSDGETRDETADQSSEPPENGSQQRQGTRTEEGRHAVPSPAGKVPRPQARRRPSNACREEGPAGSPGPPDRDAFSLSLSLSWWVARHATRRERDDSRPGLEPGTVRASEWATRACAPGRPAGPKRRRHPAGRRCLHAHWGHAHDAGLRPPAAAWLPVPRRPVPAGRGGVPAARRRGRAEQRH